MTGKNASNVSNAMAERKDKLRARIALAVQNHISPGECPSAEELAAFTDGVLDEKKREKVVAHLNACPDCRDEWLEVTSALEHDAEESRVIDFSEAAARAKDQGQSRAGRRGIKETVEKVFFRLPRSVHTGIGLALAASLILLVWYGAHPPQPEMNTLIAQSYGYYSDMGSRQGRIDPESFRLALHLPWEGSGSAYGFSSSQHPSEASVAFAAGLWAGREQLAGERSPLILPKPLRPSSQKESASSAVWDKSAYSRYYWAGQWVMLLEAVCLPDRAAPDAAFWEKQKKTLDKGTALFLGEMTKEAKELTEDFKRIGSSIGELEKNPLNRRSCSNLKLDLDHLVQSLVSE